MAHASPADPEQVSDAEAVARARRGDPEAFRVLVERYQGRAYGQALRMLGDTERARDAVQEGFLRAYRGLPRFQGRSAFYTWLYRLMFNVCIDAKRRDRSRLHVEWDDAVAREVPAEVEDDPQLRIAPGPDQAMERAELGGALRDAIGKLPVDARRTLLLREVDGLSYAEIAQALEIPKGTVMSRLHYARRQLREELVDSGIVDESGEVGGGMG